MQYTSPPAAAGERFFLDPLEDTEIESATLLAGATNSLPCQKERRARHTASPDVLREFDRPGQC